MNDKTHNQRMAMIMEEKFAGYYKDYNHIQNLLKSFADSSGEVNKAFSSYAIFTLCPRGGHGYKIFTFASV